MKRAPLALIVAISQFAYRKLSAADAAVQLTSSDYPLTRDAVIGIANRNDIKFRPTLTGGAVRRGEPRKRRTDQKPETTRPARVPITQYTRPKLAKAPPPECAWFGCTCKATAGLFCDEHARKPLL